MMNTRGVARCCLPCPLSVHHIVRGQMRVAGEVELSVMHHSVAVAQSTRERCSRRPSVVRRVVDGHIVCAIGFDGISTHEPQFAVHHCAGCSVARGGKVGFDRPATVCAGELRVLRRNVTFVYRGEEWEEHPGGRVLAGSACQSVLLG